MLSFYGPLTVADKGGMAFIGFYSMLGSLGHGKESFQETQRGLATGLVASGAMIGYQIKNSNFLDFFKSNYCPARTTGILGYTLVHQAHAASTVFYIESLASSVQKITRETAVDDLGFKPSSANNLALATGFATRMLFFSGCELAWCQTHRITPRPPKNLLISNALLSAFCSYTANKNEERPWQTATMTSVAAFLGLGLKIFSKRYMRL